MINVTLKTSDCRFGGVGDWPSYDDIRVIDLGDEKHELLVATHELIEAQLCKYRGITPEEVDNFDSNFKGQGEPGDDPNCPYYLEHQFATIVEMLLAKELGINFQNYLIATNYIAGLNKE